VNEGIVNYFARQYSKFPPAYVVTNACEELDSFEEHKHILHESLELPLHKKILLYHGQIVEERGLDVLIGAADHLSDDWVIVLMGWGEYLSYLQRLASNLKYKEKVRFLPGVERKYLLHWIVVRALKL